MRRRNFLALGAAAAADLAAPGRAAGGTGPAELPVTSDAQAGLEPFDRLMTAFVAENRVPGAALAVTHQGRLVYARGFGCADVEQKAPVRPASLFRIASVSKPFTAVAVLQLAERGRLRLDDRVTDLMKLTPFPARGTPADPRWHQITVRHCLQHTGGWDREVSFDPVARPLEIAGALGITPPVTPVHIVRYMMGRPLDFAPGARHAYSNLGYLILGRVIAAVTGREYEAHVRKEVLAPLGIGAMRLGRALIENRADGEVRYYDAKQRTGPALYPPHLGRRLPLQYGAENFEAFEAHGGWIASAVELVKFASAFDDPAACPLLGAAAVADLWARPDGAAGREADGRPKSAYYGCGWNVRPVGAAGKANTWHAGGIAGTEALLVRRFDGLNWAVLFNTRDNPEGESLAGLIDGRLHEAADRVDAWPGADRFDEFLT